MIFVDTDPEAFSLKHGIEIKQHKCYKCGIVVDVNIPWISKDFVGFTSTPHEPCGEQYKITSCKSRGHNPILDALYEE